MLMQIDSTSSHASTANSQPPPRTGLSLINSSLSLTVIELDPQTAIYDASLTAYMHDLMHDILSL